MTRTEYVRFMRLIFDPKIKDLWIEWFVPATERPAGKTAKWSPGGGKLI